MSSEHGVRPGDRPTEEHSESLAEAQRRLLETQSRLVHAQKLEAIGQLAAGIAHEINTPLQYVGDNVDFLQESFRALATLLHGYRALLERAGQVSEMAHQACHVRQLEQEADVEYILEQIPRALDQSAQGLATVSDIVQAVKQFSHPGSRERKLGSVNKAIINTVLVARHEWKCVAEVETDLQPDLPHVPLLAAEFNQVLLNLIVNAAHSIQEVVGDGARGKGLIRIGTRRCGDLVEVSVQDTGVGIPASVRGRIFDPFFTTKEPGRGSGQGLAIARSVIMDGHGGELIFETEVGVGSTFTVRLPLAPTAELVTAAP